MIAQNPYGSFDVPSLGGPAFIDGKGICVSALFGVVRRPNR
jgi:hypothetical protein